MPTIDGLAVIVVNYGSSHLLGENLRPLATVIARDRVVIVDNFSSGEERAAITRLAEGRWSTVLVRSNLGFGGGMNAGIAHARSLGATTFLLLNPDATIDADSVRALHRHVIDNPFTMVAPRILRPDGSTWFAGSDLYLEDGRIRSTRRRSERPGARSESWLSGACLMMSGELLERVGGFTDKYFLYWEDVDLSYRVVHAGGTLEVRSEAVALHAEGGTQGSGHHAAGQAKSAVYYYYNIRNRLLFASENLDSPRLRDWMRSTLPVAREVLLQGGRRQFLRSPMPVIAGMRGVRDGLKIARRELARRAPSP